MCVCVCVCERVRVRVCVYVCQASECRMPMRMRLCACECAIIDSAMLFLHVAFESHVGSEKVKYNHYCRRHPPSSSHLSRPIRSFYSSSLVCTHAKMHTA